MGFLAISEIIPPGVTLPFAGSTAPSGWLLCDGSSLSRTTYATLFAAISTTYGSVDGNSFNLPDLRGRSVAGKDNMGGTAANRITSGGSGITGTLLGSAGGAETHTLTIAQMPSHKHPQGAPQDPGLNGYENVNRGAAGGTTGSYTSTQPYTFNAGGDGAHNNTQPTIILNYIIKT